jgi:glycosyltransferase involved in cell wall biosynthesis
VPDWSVVTALKIAQVAPLYESVPPAKYGGTERIVSYLTEELVRQGHDVTLFASGDSNTAAKLVSPCARSLRLDSDCRDPLASHVVLIEMVARRQAEFDLIHFHTEHLQYLIASRISTPMLTTLHGRLDLAELPMVFHEFPQTPLVSISNSQREPLPWVNWVGTVYHGLPADLYHFEPDPEQYLAFVGRVSPEKGVDTAIEIAKRAGMPLRIAAKVDAADKDYFEEKISPLLSDPDIEFIEEVDDDGKQDLIGHAAAFLFPIQWPEPFGLVMIEAMACGTPVIAFPCGSVPEIIEPGVNGMIANNVDQAVEAIHNLSTLRRPRCRESFEKRFTASRMAKDYLALYAQLGVKRSRIMNEVNQCS